MILVLVVPLEVVVVVVVVVVVFVAGEFANDSVLLLYDVVVNDVKND
jgi:hypothetical protein